MTEEMNPTPITLQGLPASSFGILQSTTYWNK